jgi:DNA-binding response OmpR family regulator
MTAKSAHVLVVDDEPHLCNALRRILEKGGYQVTTTTDGQTALELVQEKPPDVVLLDLMMPGLDGREVCRRIRESGTQTRIVYFTAKADASDPVKLKELREEADGFLVKPATSRQILAKVASMLQDTAL